MTPVWRPALIVLAGALVYANALSGPFIFDDSVAVVDNSHIRSLRFPDALIAERENPAAGRPLVNLSFAINFAAGGLRPTGYHLWNVAVHLLCALTAFGLLRLTLGADGLALAAALIWVVHPLNSEAVDYVTERSESMMALFYLLTLYAAPRPGRWTALAVIACALGMGCKESMVTAPVAVVLYDRAFVFESWQHAWRKRWPLYAMLAATWLLLVLLLRSGPRMHSAGFSSGFSPFTYLLNQSVMIVRYLRLAIWPSGLVINYGWPAPLTLADVWPYALAVLVALGAAMAAWFRSPKLGFAGLVFFLTLAPTSSIVPIATEVGAERRMYLPLVALTALFVWTTRRTWGPPLGGPTAGPAKAGHYVLVGVIVIALGATTVARNREYASPGTMARTVHERWPTPVSRAMVGLELEHEGRHEEGISFLREASAGGYPVAQYHLAGILFSQNRTREAIPELQRFLAQAPMLTEAVNARVMLGRAYMNERRWDEAIGELQQARRMDASNVDALGLLADSQFARRQYAEAASSYAGFIAARPNDAGALTNLGVSLESIGRGDDALRFFLRAVEADPKHTGARNNLVAALLNRNAFAEAARHAQAAVANAPNDALAHDQFGRALASMGELGRAAEEFERALKIDPAFSQAREDLALVRTALRAVLTRAKG